MVANQQLPLPQVRPQPIISYSNLTPGKQYTLIMSDPDAPQADWLHWLIVNDTGTTKTTLVDYAPPSPPSGIHRYIFYLCEQTAPINLTVPPDRSNFNTHDFIKRNKLRIVSTSQFQAKAEQK